MKLRPNPSTSPRTTGRLVSAATHETAPVRAMASQNTPVTSPEAHIIAGLTVLACVTATVAMAFIGCTDMGVRKYSPVASAIRPNPRSTAWGSRRLIVT